MKFTLESTSATAIRSVASGQFRIGEQTWTTPIALTVDGVLDNWQAKSIADLTVQSLAPLLELQPELIVIGTGSRQALPDRDLMFAMARAGIGLEMMDTPAAARTFNVLINEGRAVAAIMYPTDA